MAQHLGLILAAHGSRRKESNEEVALFARKLALKLLDVNYVSVAFLELAEPSIPQAIEKAVQAGCGEIVVIPYFLAAGSHVQTDVPKIIQLCQQDHPELSIRLTAHLGASPELETAVLSLL